MAQPKGYVDTQYLRATAALLGQIKQRSYELMHIHPGQSILDCRVWRRNEWIKAPDHSRLAPRGGSARSAWRPASHP